MTNVVEDAVWSSLRGLRDLEPDAARAQHVRERCCGLMKRRQRRVEERASRGRYTRVLLERALAASLGAGYLLAIGREVLRLFVDR